MPFFAWLIGTHGWRMNFHVCLVLGLIPLYLLWRHVADTPRQAKGINAAELAHIEAGQEQAPASAEEKIPVAVRFKAFAGNYRYWLLVFWYLCLQCMYWGRITWLPSYLKTARGFSWSEMGWLASLPFVLSIFCKASSGILADKVGRSAPILMCAMLVSPEQYADVARVAVSEGYDAIKVDVLAMDEHGNWNQRDLKGLLPDNILRLGYDRLKAMRDAIGPDVDIIVEMHSFTSAAPAIQFGRMIEELGVLYYEEPVMPLNPKMMKQVADHVNIPLASGERIYWRWGYRPFLEDGSLSVIQPDICTCGGISEVKKICDMAHVYDVTVQIHVCGGPISTAAALHMEAAIPNFMIHELHRYALLEPNTRTCIHNYMPSKGRYTVPELPGLGQELTPETIAASDIITVK